MATLTGRSIASSYTELLKTTSSSGITASLDTVQDGDATDSALQLSSGGVKSTGTLEVAGTTLLSDAVTLGEDVVLIFEGATDDAYETTLTVADPTADRVLTLPDATDTIVGRATTDTLTNKTLTSPVVDTGISGTAVLDDDTFGTATSTTVATSESIKTYVDAQITAEDLDFAGDSGTGSVDLDSQTFTIDTGANLTTAASSQTLTVNLDTTITGLTSVTSTGFTGALTGNADTATALETARTIGGTSFNGTANIVPATITVADTTDTTCSVGLFESATGDLGPKSDAGLTYNAGTGMLTATGLTGPLTGDVTGDLTGNADTVTTNANLTGDVTSSGNATTYNGTLGVAKGGTNLTSYAAGDVLYASGATTLAKLAKGSDTEVLTLASGVPTWAAPTVGDITRVTAGDGLTGGGTSGDVTLDVDLKANGGLVIESEELAVDLAASSFTNTLANASLANSAVTVGSTSISLGGTGATIAGLTLTSPVLGTPTSGTLTNCTAYPGDSSLVTTGTITSGTWQGTAIAADQGGTGQTVYTVGDIVYADTTTSLSKLLSSTAGYILTAAGAGVAPAWAAAPAASVDIGSSIPSGTEGSILFIDSSKQLAQDNANLFWDDGNNRLGIGTDSPTAVIHVDGSNVGNYVGRFTNSHGSSGSGIRIQVPGTATNEYQIVSKSDAGSQDNFWVRNDGMASFPEGPVGIGEADPAHTLHVVGPTALFTGSSYFVLEVNGGTGDAVLQFSDSGGEVASIRIDNSDGDVLGFRRSSTSVNDMVIDSSGNVGIGTAVPGTELTFGADKSVISVATSDGYDTKSVMMVGGGSSSDSRGAYVWAKGNEYSSEPGCLKLNAGNISTGDVIISTAGTERLTVDNGGRVTVRKASNSEVDALTSSTSITPDFDASNNFSLTLDHDTTLQNPGTPDPVPGQSGCIVITQGSTGGTMTYGSEWLFEGGTEPELSTGAGDVDNLVYYVAAVDKIHAVLLKDFS